MCKQTVLFVWDNEKYLRLDKNTFKIIFGKFSSHSINQRELPGPVILGNLEVQVLHHGPHHVIHVGVDVEVSLLVLLGRLEVADHKAAILVILLSVGWHVS